MILHKFSDNALMFANRLVKKRKHLRKWIAREAINAYRVYDADIPEYAIAVDVYNTDDSSCHIVVSEYQAPATIDPEKAEQRLQESLEVIRKEFNIAPDNLYLKVRKKQKGSAQYEKLKSKKRVHELTEFGSRFLVNFSDYLDTGLFLDHRAIRRLIFQLSKNKRFLNLFAYTGSATVYAARGGAKNTTTVDMSNTYIETARANMALNSFTQAEHEYIQADCLQWLERQANTKKKRYDLIFLDPPAFSTSKRMTKSFDVQRDHATIIRQCMLILADTGILLFSNNNRSFRIDSGLMDDYEISEISSQTIPKDFEGNRRIHNSWQIKHMP